MKSIWFTSLNDVKSIFKLGSGNKLLFLSLSLPFSLPISHHNQYAHDIGKECPPELTCLQCSPSMHSTENRKEEKKILEGSVVLSKAQWFPMLSKAKPRQS